ncbi:MAG: hypothetical protein P8012_15860 [Desulfobacterales bacterium]
MANKVNIPDELIGTYQRLLFQIPEKLRNDSHTQQITQLYLKLGGEKLARQYIEIVKMNIREEERLNKVESEDQEDSDEEDEFSDYDS